MGVSLRQPDTSNTCLVTTKRQPETGHCFNFIDVSSIIEQSEGGHTDKALGGWSFISLWPHNSLANRHGKRPCLSCGILAVAEGRGEEPDEEVSACPNHILHAGTPIYTKPRRRRVDTLPRTMKRRALLSEKAAGFG